jgi:hypothetical protein
MHHHRDTVLFQCCVLKMRVLAAQAKSAEALAADLEAFLWPHGSQGGSGRAWDSLDLATEAITQFMQTQGCSSLKVKNQSFFDSAKTRVTKRVFKSPCAGVYIPRAVESIAVEGRARQTSTRMTDCSVFINVNVEGRTGDWPAAC